LKILGTGSALPKLRVTNDRLAEILDTSDEWIVSRTGIRERRLLSDETLQSLAEAAAKNALSDAGVAPVDIDFVLVSTVLAETLSPALAMDIQNAVGLRCMGMDINAGCTGFIAALSVADGLMAAGMAKHILVVSAEALSRFTDWTDRATAVLFGDAAAAVVLGPGEGVKDILFDAEPRREVLHVDSAPGNSPFAIDPRPACYLKMSGQEVYKFAVSHSLRDIRRMLDRQGLLPGDVDYYLLHQANMRILDGVRHRLNVGEERFPHDIEFTGNTSSCSIPLLMDIMKKDGRLVPGARLILSAFGAGLCTATAYLEWR